MVFFYTNYAAETNSWWLRRIRPLWVVPVVLAGFYKWYTTVYFGPRQSAKELSKS